MGILPSSPSAAAVALDTLTALLAPARVAEIEGQGRGVVAARRIVAGELIERAPVVVTPLAQVTGVLEHYVYDWPYLSEDAAVALGMGSLYNHSYAPNAIYTKHIAARFIEYRALRDIEEGEEIVVNYNGAPDDQTPLWFDVR